MRFLLLIVAAAILATSAGIDPTHADVFQLEDGGKIVGTLIEHGKDGESVIRSESGALVTLEESQIRKVVRVGDDLLEYQQRSRSIPDTVEAHHRLAAWCKEHQLSRQRKHHLKRVLELDPSDREARMSLGYQEHQGRWLTRDQIMQAWGLEMYKGDYRSAQEIALLKRRDKFEHADADWFDKLKLWRRWLDSRRRDEALANLRDVRDPMAAPALIKLLDRERNLEIQELYLSILGELPHAAAIEKLVEFSIYDPLPEIREMCLESLLRNHQPVPLTPYTKALKSRENEVVRQAAEALHRIENPEAISPLIDALVTTHKFNNPNAPQGNMNAAFAPGGGGGGGLAMGGNKNKVIRVAMRNDEVLRALVDLSGGQNYEFNEEAWRRWYVNTQIYENVDARRDE